MELQDLRNGVILFVLVGMLLGLGITLLGNVGDAGSKVETVTNESIVIPAINGTRNLAHTYITSTFRLTNYSDGTSVSFTNYTVSTNGTIQIWDNTTYCKTGSTCYAYYTYTNYDTESRTAVVAVNSAISTIATSWMGLIILVVVMSILIALVVKSFGVGATRK